MSMGKRKCKIIGRNLLLNLQILNEIKLLHKLYIILMRSLIIVYNNFPYLFNCYLHLLPINLFGSPACGLNIILNDTECLGLKVYFYIRFRFKWFMIYLNSIA